MLHNLWCASLDCHNLAQVILHLRPRIDLDRCIVRQIVSFLKLPELNILACIETSAQVRYAFGNPSCQPFDFDRHQFPEEGWLITCDFNFQLLVFNWGSTSDVGYTVRVVSRRQQQDITRVIDPSVAISHDGMELAVPVFVSGHGCIAIYDVIDNANSLLGDRREIFWPESLFYCFFDTGMQMAFSPTGATLVLAGCGQVFFLDVIDEMFSGWSCRYDDFDIRVLQYSPDGRFVVAAGSDVTEYGDGFLYMFNEHGHNLWNLDSESIGEGLPGIHTLAFSSCSTKVACCALQREQVYKVYIVDVDSGHAYPLTMTHSVDAIVFDPSGQRLIMYSIIDSRSVLCIIDSRSGAKFHEVTFSDPNLRIAAMSWPVERNADD